MNHDTAMVMLRELEDLAVRLCVQEGRLPGDADVADLKRCVAERRDLVIAYLAALRVAEVADRHVETTIH